MLSTVLIHIVDILVNCDYIDILVRRITNIASTLISSTCKVDSFRCFGIESHSNENRPTDFH